MMTGGSPMGEAFLDMFAIDPNPCGAFLEFVKGQAALKKISGCEPPLPKKARKRKADMRPDGPSKYDLGKLPVLPPMNIAPWTALNVDFGVFEC
jgi:hypothetical protein